MQPGVEVGNERGQLRDEQTPIRPADIAPRQCVQGVGERQRVVDDDDGQGQDFNGVSAPAFLTDAIEQLHVPGEL